MDVNAGNSNSSQADEATNALRNRILDLTLRPGSRIDEPQLQALLSFGRTPIREGINRLISEGLLELTDGRGVYVASLDVVEIAMLFDAYAASERLSAFFCDFGDDSLLEEVRQLQARQREAFQARDYLQVSYWGAAFRTRIAKSSHNKHILDFCRRLNNQVRRITFFVWTNEARQSGYMPPRSMESLQSAITDAIAAQDRDKLVAELDAQVDILRQRTLRVMSHSTVPKFTPVGRTVV